VVWMETLYLRSIGLLDLLECPFHSKDSILPFL
jgi:hypothetical protein